MDISSVVQVDLIDRGQVTPAVVMGDDKGGAEFHRELLASVRRLRSNGWSDAHIERYVRTVRRLAQYYVARGCPVLDEQGLVHLVWDYLSSRLYGTVGRNQSDPLDLYWAPSRWKTVKHDCRAIADYSDYCAAAYGYLPLIGSSRGVSHAREGFSHAELQSLKKVIERSFLGHLRVMGHKPQSLPMPGRKQPSTSGLGRSVVTVQQAWDIIDAEKHPVYRMVWTLGFWGGPRVSEQLNMWRLDVLPGELRTALFDRDPFRELPLVVLANPWESTYCGSIGDATTTRRQHLMKCFGQCPRPDLKWLEGGARKGQWAGWKGMLETNDVRHISQVFWASAEAAHEYYLLYSGLMERHADLGTSLRHPYLLINLDRRRPETLGDPLKLSNLCKAWERAVRRVGLEPYRFGVSLHGMRHFFKSYIETLGVGRKVKKLMLRHRSEESQDHYGGIDAQALRHALALGRRHWTSIGASGRT